jgi:hypothetical protein
MSIKFTNNTIRYFSTKSQLFCASASAIAIGLAALAIPSVVQAQNECGVAPVGGGTVTCLPDASPYATGITYASPTDNLTIVLQEGANIDTSGSLNAGVTATSGGTAGITVSSAAGNTIITSGAGAAGVQATTNSGALSLGLADVTTSGAAATGISAASNGGAVAVSSRNVTSTGAGATAINATSSAGDVNITSTGSVIANGANAGGIFATSNTGNTAITANNVSTVSAAAADAGSGRAAIFASGRNAAVTVNGTASTAGTGFGGANSATVAAIATDGNASAIINSASASGAGVNAVRVIGSQNATATLNGQIRSTGAGTDAVVVTGGDRATVTVGANAAITATGGDGIVLTSANGSTFNNAGVIGINNAGFAVSAFGGPLQINNTGTLTSDIRFTGGADVVNNQGTFVVGTATDFGAGANVFNNSGIVRFAEGATAPVSRTFTGLGSFNNSGGIIDLRNGVAGDTLTLPGNFAGTGDSRIGLDVNVAEATTWDRVVIAGAATGSTGLVVDLTGAGTLGSGVVLVEAGAGTQAGAFTLDGGARNFGLIETDLVFDATTNDFSLVGAPGAGVYRAAGFVDLARNVWHKSADAVAAHLRGARDGAWAAGEGSPSGGLWVQMHASRDRNERSVDANNFGLARNFNLGSDQDYFGGQLGFDFGGGIGGEGNFAFGVTGGYINSEVGFAGVTDRLSMDVYNAGAYATINSGNLFLNVLGKYDLIRGRSESQIGQFNERIRGDSYGAQGEIGIRFGSEAFFVEPIATVAFVRTNLNELEVQNSTLQFRGDDGLRGKLGARIGASIAGFGANEIVLYAGGNYVREFKSEDEIGFVNGGQTINIAQGPRGDYGEGLIGVNISATNMVSGFVEANGAKGSEFDAFGGRAGLRIRF